MSKLTSATFPTSFGVFSPTGHIVMAFDSDADARKARQALVKAGFAEHDVTHYTAKEVLDEFELSDEQRFSPVQIGQDVTKVEEYTSLAKEGSGFLVVHAPKKEDAKQAISIVGPFGLKFAEKYNWLTIEELA